MTDAMKRDTMPAVVFDGRLSLTRRPVPQAPPGWARIRVRRAGICKTDLEIVKGYMGYGGILGHEFVGTVDRCEDAHWVGRRVTGEINAACGRCDWCLKGLGRHCPHRRALGILGLDGCMAAYCCLPVANLREVPTDVDDRRAVFVELLSAACEILEQVPLSGTERTVVLGDGRLGILCAWALASVLPDVTLIGRHPEKLARAAWRQLKTALGPHAVAAGADLVIEATGSTGGLAEALALCRPRGTIVLKSTVARPLDVDLAPLVVNEITLVGSRCGRFEAGLKLMADFSDLPLASLVSAEYPLEDAMAAFARAAEPDTLKILLVP